MEPIYRPATMDLDIWNEVYTKNEYRLPDDMSNEIVLDIGCHVGAFSAAAKLRNVSEIFAVEMELDNLRRAILNVNREKGQATFQSYHAAAWRSDCRGARIRSGGHDGINTGGAWSVPNTELLSDIPTIPFDDVVKIASDFFRRRIDMVKLDCEGAEWPILFTSKTLHIIDHLCGEYHAGHFDGFAYGQKVQGLDYSIDALRQLLKANGFIVEIEPPNKALYAHFWATRA